MHTDSDGTGTIVFDGNPPGRTDNRLTYNIGEDDGVTPKRLKSLSIKNDATLALFPSSKYHLSQGITTEEDGKGSIKFGSDYDLNLNIGESGKRLKQITIGSGDKLNYRQSKYIFR